MGCQPCVGSSKIHPSLVAVAGGELPDAPGVQATRPYSHEHETFGTRGALTSG